jgi:hypothetical protein
MRARFSLKDKLTMKTLYEFTPDERRVVVAAFERYLQVAQVIADIHGVAGAQVSADLSGFVELPKPQA